MVVDVVRAYLEAASGLTELTRKRAVAAAKTLLRESDERTPPRASDGGNGAETPVLGARVGPSIQALATELVETSRSNRAAIGRLVEDEVTRLLGRLDVVPRDDYDRLARRVAELERRLASVTAAQRRRSAAGDAEPPAAPERPAAEDAPAVEEGPVEEEKRSDSRPSPDTRGTPEAAEAADTSGEAAEAGRKSEKAVAVEQPRQRSADKGADTSGPRSAARGGAAKSARSRSTKSQTKRSAARRGSARNGNRS